MDKQSRKDIKKKYKAEDRLKSLSKLLDSEYSWIRDFSQVELGNSLPPITKGEIDAAENGFDLTERLYYKMLELVRRSDPNIKTVLGQQTEAAIDGLSNYLQVVYHTYGFESILGVGDIDKHFTFFSDEERTQLEETNKRLKHAYALMDCEQMIALIEKGELTQDYDALQEIVKMYDPKTVEEKRLKFIKRHWQEYIIN
ncbi:hypothetical protein [Cesiribacter andamanensis]|uniref:Uncharacterized protein n=1 Tax=Cesiribacter andamanensis AMV16 TaxID=1279009 RepID=M7NSB8_9BACT|nr:hypothetical protein [Cesiribacter andamanensis]EMR01364.1 hypothetical protein ADICEAN_03496 [Cesiribacter andamanensis AMV16]